MSTGRDVLDLLRRLGLSEGETPSDGTLLAAFAQRRDEAALTALIHRHGGMVWGVCRRLLGDGQDAEDAFQATFLVLVRKAAGLRQPEKVAGWLHGVARQTAVRLRALRARRGRHEKPVATLPEPVPPPERRDDVGPILDEELARLPDTYRAVLLLCDVEGRPRGEVAAQLGWPEGTVAGRLARARALLAERLARRGVPRPGDAPASPAPAALVAETVRAAATGACSLFVTTLTEGVLRAMVLKQLTFGAAMLAFLLCLTGGLLVYPAAQPQPPGEPPARPALAGPAVEPPAVSERVKKDLGERTLDVLAGATRVEALRLDYAPRDAKEGILPGQARNREQRWKITATGKEQGREFAAKVRAFVCDEATRTASNAGGYRGDVAFRLWKDGESVTVVVDLVGSWFLIVTRDADGKEVQAAVGGFLFNQKGEFDGGDLYGRARALAVEAFPEDATLGAFRGDLGALLEKAGRFDLLSLNPERTQDEPPKSFHGWKVLGKTTVTDAAARGKVVAAFKDGVEASTPLAAGCFRPRHGIRLTHDGRSFDFLICFECLFVQVFEGDRPERVYRITGSPQRAFDRVLRDAGVPLPTK